MKKIIAAILKRIGRHRGAPRLYIEGQAPARGGFTPGVRYSLERHEGRQALVLRLDRQGTKVVSRKVKSDREQPVIDLNSHEALGLFADMESVRVIIRPGEIWIVPEAVEVRRRERVSRLASELAEGRISTAAIAHGAGVMTHAMHTGLKDAGIQPRLKWAIELEEDALDQACRVNDAWSGDTIAVAMPLQQVAFADSYVRGCLEPVSLLEAGLPCTAASVAGRSKKRLAQAEDDGAAGHLVAGFLALVAQANPAIMVLENVVPYFSTASAAILRTQLRELGYDVQEVTIEGGDYAIETRTRRVMVAVTHGLSMDVEAFLSHPAPEKAHRKVGDVLEPVAADDPCWSAMTYLREKEARDAAAGKGFRMAIVGPDATEVGTIGAGYQKNRSTEPKLAHPENPALLRLFTPVEHARLKGIPEKLIAGVESATRAHEMLGQSVIWPAFRHLGHFIGQSIRPLAQLRHPVMAAAA